MAVYLNFFNFFLLILLTNNSLTSNLSSSNDAKLSSEDLDLKFTINQDFEIIEYSEIEGRLNNVTSIDIELPSKDWNVTDVELNFSNIRQHRQIETIEDKIYSTFKYIYYSYWDRTYYLGVQFNISEPTTIYGVYLYGKKAQDTTEKINVSITKYHDIENRPTSPVYYTQELNISNEEGWYLQNFSLKPITLSKNRYYLILDGWNIKSSKTIYYWGYNKFDPTYESLYSAEYDGVTWSNFQGEPFLCKIIQKLNKSYNPEHLEMFAELNGLSFEILNGKSEYSGTLEVDNLNYAIENEKFHIPIKNLDDSLQLIFDVSYNVKVQKDSSLKGEIVVQENKLNKWIISGDIDKPNENYSIKFTFPVNWVDISIYINEINITNDILIKDKQNFFIISDKFFFNGDILKIIAYSESINFSLNIPKDSFKPGQTLKFSLEDPVLKGNYYFILIDPLGFEEHRELKNIPPDNSTFEYEISLNPNEGIWKAYIYWINESDAGVSSQFFNIVNPTEIINTNGNDDNNSDSINISGIDPQYFILTILIIIFSIIGGITSYQIIRTHKKKMNEKRNKIFNTYKDIQNLEYIIVVDKNSGLNIHEKILSRKDLNATLVSGFLQAIGNFGIELTGTEIQSQTIKLEYQNLKIIMSEYKDFRIVNIMRETPSQEFFSALRPLSIDIDKQFGNILENYNGKRVLFEGIDILLEKHLQLNLLYPLKLMKSRYITQNINSFSYRIKESFSSIRHLLSVQNEKALINKARQIMKLNNSNHFFISELISEIEFNARKAQCILNLINRKVFQPAN